MLPDRVKLFNKKKLSAVNQYFQAIIRYFQFFFVLLCQMIPEKIVQKSCKTVNLKTFVLLLFMLMIFRCRVTIYPRAP